MSLFGDPSNENGHDGLLTSTFFLDDVLPWLRVEVYDRDGGHRRPRVRFELKPRAPTALVARALALEVPCVACGEAIHPFRARKLKTKRGTAQGHIYLAVACALDENIGCSRGSDAAEAYTRIKKAFHDYRARVKHRVLVKVRYTRRTPPSPLPDGFEVLHPGLPMSEQTDVVRLPEPVGCKDFHGFCWECDVVAWVERYVAARGFFAGAKPVLGRDYAWEEIEDT